MENQDLTTVFGTSRSFKEQLHDPNNPNVYCLLRMDGKDFLLKNSYTVELHQKTADHDTFTITVPDDALDSFKGYVLENSKNILGNDLTITYWQFGTTQQVFSGIIGGIDNLKNEGSGYGDLVISGFSPSILLESGQDCQSFEDKTLEQIIREVCGIYPKEAQINVDLPNVKHSLPFTVQYKESDYQFIRRLAIYHGEFFYYNGEQMIFGAGTQPILKLKEGNELIDVKFSLKIGAQDFGYTGYNAQSGAKIEKNSKAQQSEFKENLFQSVAVNRSGNLFKKKPKMHFNHTGIAQQSEKELEEAVRLEKEKRENLMQVTGRSSNPALRIGGRAELSDINGKAMETYRIIEIKHVYDPGEYYNEFTAIPDLFNAAPYIDTEAVPKGEEQPARVTDNNDPMGMGRVRVQFPWQEDKNQMTPWIRLIQPHSGAGKGFHFIPEIGEEVLVGFESGNAEKPFVMGTHYNGSETSSYHTRGNDKKVIHTRSGTKIIMNDAEGSVFIEDPSGNTYLMDGAGNINVNAPKNMSFTAGENVTITAGMNIISSAGMNISETAGMNHSSFAGAMMMQNAVADYSLMAANITEMAQGERKSKAKEVTDQSSNKKIISENKNEVHTKGTFDNNSGENSKLH
jgi:type VI secretion system secreted protein VgrG